MILQALHVAAGIRCDVRNNDVLPQKASLLKLYLTVSHQNIIANYGVYVCGIGLNMR